MSKDRVKLYTISTCSHCKRTKRFLSDCNIVYDYVDVDLLGSDERKQVLEEVRSLNPRCSFPTIRIGNKVIIGFREDEIKEALGL